MFAAVASFPVTAGDERSLNASHEPLAGCAGRRTELGLASRPPYLAAALSRRHTHSHMIRMRCREIYLIYSTFTTTYRRRASTAVLMLLGLGVASAATVPWSPLAPRAAPNVALSGLPSAQHLHFGGVAPFGSRSTSGPDGVYPNANLVDVNGVLYGTTVLSGKYKSPTGS